MRRAGSPLSPPQPIAALEGERRAGLKNNFRVPGHAFPVVWWLEKAPSDLQNVSFARHHPIEDRVDEKAQEQARNQSGDHDNGKWTLGVGTDAVGERRRQQTEAGHKSGHHDGTQAEEGRLVRGFADSFAA